MKNLKKNLWKDRVVWLYVSHSAIDESVSADIWAMINSMVKASLTERMMLLGVIQGGLMWAIHGDRVPWA